MSIATTMHTAVRRAEEADLPALCALLERLFALEEDFEFDPGRSRAGLAAMLEHPAGVLLAADDGRGVAGMVSGQVTVSTAEGGPAVVVEDLVVREDARGRGIGSALLAALERWALARGARRMQLLADVDNTPALDFYRRRGWTGTNLVCLRRVMPQGG